MYTGMQNASKHQHKKFFHNHAKRDILFLAAEVRFYYFNVSTNTKSNVGILIIHNIQIN